MYSYTLFFIRTNSFFNRLHVVPEVDMQDTIIITTIVIVVVAEEEDINLKVKIMVNNLDINKVVMKVTITLNIVNIMRNMVMVNQDKRVKVISNTQDISMQDIMNKYQELKNKPEIHLLLLHLEVTIESHRILQIKTI